MKPQLIPCTSSFGTVQGIPRSLLAAYCAAKAGATPGPTYDLLCSTALKLLSARCLLNSDDRYVDIHPLSQAVWRTIFKKPIPDIAIRLDGLMRQLALKDVVESRPTASFASQEEYMAEHPRGEVGTQQDVKALWDSHYFALLNAVEGKLPLEELGYDVKRGGCGSRAHLLLKYTLFVGLPHGGAKWEQELQAELQYFGVTKDEAVRLLFYSLHMS